LTAPNPSDASSESRSEAPASVKTVDE